MTLPTQTNCETGGFRDASFAAAGDWQLVLAAPDVDARVFVEKQAAKLSAFRDFDLTCRGITPTDPARQLQQKAELFLLQP